MKLSTAQILTIDEYLKRSGVNYLDVRMELLDHFIEAIEAKLTATELSFDEALMEVTIAFGNDIQERHLLNRDRTDVLFSGIFSNNKGFKELEEEKRKQIRKQYLKKMWQQFKENFRSSTFYADYLCFALAMYLSFQYLGDWALVVASGWLTIEILKTLYVTRKYKFTQDSLRGEMSSKITSVFFSITLNLYLYMKIVIKMEAKHIFWVMVITLMFYPILKAVLSVHRNIYAQYKKYCELTSA